MEQPLVRRLTPGFTPAVAFALPGTILACGLAAHLMFAVGGAPSIWSDDRINISEAAAMRDGATVLHLMRGGESVRERHLVRPGILFGEAKGLTPLEAGIAARRAEVVELVLVESPELDWTTWRDAKCLADGNADLERVIDAHRPGTPNLETGAAVLDCEATDTPWE